VGGEVGVHLSDDSSIDDWATFGLLLQEIYRNAREPSLRSVSARAANAGWSISAGTVLKATRGEVPSRKMVAGYLRGCGMTETSCAEILAVWDRLKSEEDSDQLPVRSSAGREGAAAQVDYGSRRQRREAAYRRLISQVDMEHARSLELLAAYRYDDEDEIGRLAEESLKAAEEGAASATEDAAYFSRAGNNLAASIARRMQWVALSFAQFDYIGDHRIARDVAVMETLLVGLTEARAEFLHLAQTEFGQDFAV
jgi:hypothetical protein